MPRINIFVKSFEGKSITLWLPENSTIQFVKMLVEDKFPKFNLIVPNWNFSYFTFQGKNIYDISKTLNELGIGNNHTLYLRLRVGDCSDRPCLHMKLIQQSIVKDAAKAAATTSHFKDVFKSVAKEAAISVATK